MLYAVLCYNSEDELAGWTQQQDDALMAKLDVVKDKLLAESKLGPYARLMPTTSALTIRTGAEPLVLDGPFAETKEQLLGFYVLDCATFEEAVEATRLLARERPSGSLELRPFRSSSFGSSLK